MCGQWGGKGIQWEKAVMEEIQENYETAARFMVTAYEQTNTQNDAVEFVRKHFQGVDTLTLIAMWKAVEAYIPKIIEVA